MSDEDLEPESIDDDAPPNAADAQGIERQKRFKKKADREAFEFWSAIFATDVGRREMWKLLQEAHPFEIRYGCGPNGFPDQQATWAALGEQLLGIRIYQTWQHLYPEGVRLMLAESDPRFTKAN